jgi:hypothetical protein
MIDTRGRRTGPWWRSPFIKLAGYYVGLGLVVFGLLTAFPALRDEFSLERLRALAESSTFPGVTGDASLTSESSIRNPLMSGLTALFAIVGAIALLIPVVWVYMLTKQERGYDESVVHTVLILPVPVTGLVIVVQFSVALAFSLAGIVAAVRFRNTLDDTKDAVYIFLAIGTALAAGAQALGIAAVTSIVFNYLVLFMWKYKIGNIYADQLKRTPKMRLGDVLAGAGQTPGAGTGNLTIGDPQVLAGLTPDSLAGIAERKARLREAIEAEGKEAKKYNGLLVVLANANEQYLDTIDLVLKEHTEKFKLAEITPTTDGNSTLEYLIALPKTMTGTQLIATMRAKAGSQIIAAEFRNLKVRKSKDLRTPYWTLPKE